MQLLIGFVMLLTFGASQGHPLLGLFGSNDSTQRSSIKDSSLTKTGSSDIVETSSKDIVQDTYTDGDNAGDKTVIHSNSTLKEITKEKESNKESLTNTEEKRANNNLLLLSSNRNSKVTETDIVETDREVTKDRAVDTDTKITKETKRGQSDDGSYQFAESAKESTKTTNEKLKVDDKSTVKRTKQITKEDTNSLGLGGLLALDNTKKKTTKEVTVDHLNKKRLSEKTNTVYKKSTNGTSTYTGDNGTDTDKYTSSDGYTDSSSSSDSMEDAYTTFKKTESESAATGLRLLGAYVPVVETKNGKSSLPVLSKKGLPKLGLL